jgi:hypothetical protein
VPAASRISIGVVLPLAAPPTHGPPVGTLPQRVKQALRPLAPTEAFPQDLPSEMAGQNLLPQHSPRVCLIDASGRGLAHNVVEDSPRQHTGSLAEEAANPRSLVQPFRRHYPTPVSRCEAALRLPAI